MQVDYVGHTCFRFTSAKGKVVLTDPMFGKGFEWEGHWEKYLSSPAVKVSDMPRCDVVFVSHIHGDHFDADAVMGIVGRTKAKVLAAEEVLDTLRGKGVDGKRLVALSEKRIVKMGDLNLTAYCGYDNSQDAQGRPNKFALVVESGKTRLFYSGDCHALPPAVVGMSVDAMFYWPIDNVEKLKRAVLGLKTSTLIIMHCDRFEPGAFFCNRDMGERKRWVESVLPGMTVVAPERVTQW